jgi:hypothetical protein
MNLRTCLAIGLLGASLPLRAGAGVLSWTFDSNFQNGGVIPDGDASGWTDTRNLTTVGESRIAEVRVTLNFSGGSNGDLYAYLSHGAGFAVLLNRVGVGQAQGDPFGYSDPGMSVTLATGGARGNIHWYGGGGVPSGVYEPDGRNIDPQSSPPLFDSASTTTGFDSLRGLDASGSWTLFFADVSKEGGNSVLSAWSLEVTAVPEPAATAGLIFALLAGGWRLGRCARALAETRRPSGPQLPVE